MYLSIHLSVYLCVGMYVCIYLCIYVSTCVSIYLSVFFPGDSFDEGCQNTWIFFFFFSVPQSGIWENQDLLFAFAFWGFFSLDLSSHCTWQREGPGETRTLFSWPVRSGRAAQQQDAGLGFQTQVAAFHGKPPPRAAPGDAMDARMRLQESSLDSHIA